MRHGCYGGAVIGGEEELVKGHSDGAGVMVVQVFSASEVAYLVKVHICTPVNTMVVNQDDSQGDHSRKKKHKPCSLDDLKKNHVFGEES